MGKSSAHGAPRQRVRNMDLARAFGRRLKRVIAETAIKQNKLAKALSCRPDTLSKLCTGQAQTIALDLLGQLALWSTRHGISADWLFCGLGDMRKSSAHRSAGLEIVPGV